MKREIRVFYENSESGAEKFHLFGGSRMNRAQAVDELKCVYKVLSADLENALQLKREKPTQFACRNLFRTFFAFVEGLTFQFRQVTLASLAETNYLTTPELALLREKRFQLDNKGLPVEKENNQSLLPNLLFSVRCYAKNHGAIYQPDTSHNGWESMKKAVAVRDRLTHPKSASGLEVKEEDLECFSAGSEWWEKTLHEMFAACDQADKLINQKLKAERKDCSGA